MKARTWLMVLAMVVMMCVPVRADNSARISELIKIGQKAEENKQQYQNGIVQQNSIILQCNAVIAELRSQDRAVEEAARKVEAIAKEVNNEIAVPVADVEIKAEEVKEPENKKE